MNGSRNDSRKNVHRKIDCGCIELSRNKPIIIDHVFIFELSPGCCTCPDGTSTRAPANQPTVLCSDPANTENRNPPPTTPQPRHGQQFPNSPYRPPQGQWIAGSVRPVPDAGQDYPGRTPPAPTQRPGWDVTMQSTQGWGNNDLQAATQQRTIPPPVQTTRYWQRPENQDLSLATQTPSPREAQPAYPTMDPQQKDQDGKLPYDT